MNSEENPPAMQMIEKATIGVGGEISATRGDRIVMILQKTLQIPNAVDVRITGNIIGVDK